MLFDGRKAVSSKLCVLEYNPSKHYTITRFRDKQPFADQTSGDKQTATLFQGMT
jgi:hypothetical protein